MYMISAIKKAAALLCAACLVAACDSLPDSTVSIEGGQQFSVEADATTVNGGNPVKFSASDAWVAFPVGDASEWLAVTPESGAAGDNEITITCQPNTGSRRSGTIRIQCLKGEANISVVQKGVGGDEPDVPGPEPGPDPDPDPDPEYYVHVDRVTFEPEYWADYSGYEGKRVYEFSYDDAGLIDEYSMEYIPNDGNSKKRDVRIDRSVAGQITFWEVDAEDIEGKYAEKYVVELDDSGRARTVELTERYSDYSEEYRFTYDADGHLVLVDDNGSFWRYTWRSGNLAISEDRGYEDEDWTGKFGTLANNVMNIDPNMLFISLGSDGLNSDVYCDEWPGRLDRLAMLRLTGKGSQNLLAEHDVDDEMACADDMGWPDPGVTVHKTEDGYDTDTSEKLVYDLDNDGRVLSVYYTEAVTSWHLEYDIVSSNELVHPGRPEMGYEYEIINRVRTETGRGTNRYVYKFDYSTR